MKAKVLHIFLLLCLKANPTDIVDKVTALDRYKRRYLKQTTNTRTELFITILRHYTFGSAEMLKSSQKMKELFDKLIPNDQNTTAPTEDYELIPFDIVWRRIMKFYGITI